MAGKKESTKRERAPTLIEDPLAFWRAQHAEATRDVAMARKLAPSVLPKMVSLRREAWREYKAALAAATGGAPAASSAAVPAGAPAAPPVGSLEEELAEVRRMRRQAQEAQKLTAAEKLLRRESEIAGEIRARDEAAAKAARGKMTPDELTDALASRIQAMPAAMQERIRARLGWS